jgi:hypothetical protein
MLESRHAPAGVVRAAAAQTASASSASGGPVPTSVAWPLSSPPMACPVSQARMATPRPEPAARFRARPGRRAPRATAASARARAEVTGSECWLAMTPTLTTAPDSGAGRLVASPVSWPASAAGVVCPGHGPVSRSSSHSAAHTPGTHSGGKALGPASWRPPSTAAASTA